MQIGLVTLGDWLPDPATGRRVGEAERFRQFIELGVLAEDLGFDTFHVGEHHFSEYALSAPCPVLSAVAERTARLRLSTAVSLLGHHDPVSVAEDYATVDVLSGGRVELIAGRGVYQQHYGQFGQSWEASEELLAEAVELLRRLWTTEAVTWSGRLRPPLDAVTVHPRPVQQPHPPIWLSASSPSSVERAVALGCPIAIPTISTGVDVPPVLAAQFREQWAGGRATCRRRPSGHARALLRRRRHERAGARVLVAVPDRLSPLGARRREGPRHTDACVHEHAGRADLAGGVRQRRRRGRRAVVAAGGDGRRRSPARPDGPGRPSAGRGASVARALRRRRGAEAAGGLSGPA